MSDLSSARSDRSTNVSGKKKKKTKGKPSNHRSNSVTSRDSDLDDHDEYDRSKVVIRKSPPLQDAGASGDMLTGLPGTRVKFLWKDIKDDDAEVSGGRMRHQRRDANTDTPRTKSPLPLRRTIQKPESPQQYATAVHSPSASSRRNSGELRQDLLRRILTWEKQLKSNVNDAQLPPARIEKGTESLPMAFRHACAEIIKQYPESAKAMEIDKRLWVSWYREIDGLQEHARESSASSQSTSSRSPSASGKKSHNMEDAKRKLHSVLASCAEFYTRLVAELQELNLHLQGGFQKPGEGQQSGIRFSLHMCLVALGDTARYMQKVSPSSQSRRGHHHDWSVAQQFYQRALEFLPSNGKVYNQLALLAINQRQVLMSVYLYARSLACERPFSSQENFVHAVHRGKATNPALRIRCRSIAEVQTHVAALFLSCLDIVLTGIEQDRWHTTADITLSGLKYFLGTCTSTLLARKQLDLASIQNGLDQIVCLLIFALHHLLLPSGVRHLSRTDFELEHSALGQTPNARKILALGFSIVTVVIKECAKAFLSPELMVVAKDLMNTLLPPINIYLDWLRMRPWLLTASATDSNATEFLSCTVNFLVSLSSSLLVDRIEGEDTIQLSSQLLPEDKELFGFLPCEGGLSRRQAQQEKSVHVGVAGGIDNGDGEMLLDVRMCRVLSFSEDFLRLNGHMRTSEMTWRLQDQGDAANPPELGMLELVSDAWDAGSGMIAGSGAPEQSCRWCFNTSSFTDDNERCKFCGYEQRQEEELTRVNVGDEEIARLSQLLLNSSAVTQPPVEVLSGVENIEAFFAGHSPMPSRQGSPEPPRRRDQSSPERIQCSSRSASPTNSGFVPGFAAVMAIGADKRLYDASSPKLSNAEDSPKCLIVIDAPNVAMRHGFHKKFSCIGIRLAIEYFVQRGHRVVGFLPDYLVEGDQVGERKRMQSAGIDVPASKIPDNVALLQRLVEDGLLIPTPAQDYDDTYCIQYAGNHDGCVVTNDLYRDHVENMTGPRERKVAMRSWLAAHRISYTWVGNEFLPNPNFRFPAPTTSQ